MAVSIDRVYQKVLAFANKEQRGYITPQEFNLFADQAQMEIFEQYFYDINQWTRQHGNNHEYSDMLVNLEEKIDKFASIANSDNVTVLNSYGDVNLESDLPDLYRLGSIRIKYPENAGYVTAEAIKSRKEFFLYESSPLTKRNRQRPIYHRHTHLGHDRIKIYPHPVEDDGSPIDLATQEVDLNLPHVNVSSVTHPGSYTSVGQYFYFDHDEMTALLGITTWNFDVVEILVVRDGVTIFTGDVKLWDNTNNNSIAVGPGLGHGRKQPNSTSAGGDWMIGDKIFLPGNIFQDDMRNVQVDYIRKPILRIGVM